MLRRSFPPAIAALAVDAQRAAAPAAAATGPGIVVLLLVHYRAPDVLWGLAQLARGEHGVGAFPGLRFARVLGSGQRGGFGLRPSLRRQGLIAFFDDESAAASFADSARSVRSRRERADESLTAVMRAVSCRGSWGGVALSPTGSLDRNQPVAVLTRAAIRLRHAREFWRHSPPAEGDLQHAAGLQLAVGLGEAPLLRQATFSLWDNTPAMERYAQHGAHRRASDGAWREHWFDEWMFARFVPLSIRGTWQGRRHG
jgi:hypothetical protein